MTSPVKIANQGLIRIGVKKIVAFTDQVKSADVMSLIYENSRDTLLKLYPFKFAKKRAILAPLSLAPKWGYEYAYELPADYVRLITVDGHYVDTDLNGLPNDYVIEGRQILTNQNTSIKIIYICNSVPEVYYDPDFVRLLALQLALDGFTALAGRGVGRGKIESEYLVAIETAKRNGSLEEPNQHAYSAEWENTRNG
jgi:hypothetical protein